MSVVLLVERRSAQSICSVEASLPFCDHNGTCYAIKSISNWRKPNSIFGVSIAGEQAAD